MTDRKVNVRKGCKPNLKRSCAVNKDLVVMEMSVTKLKLNKPIYVRLSVFKISKSWMYKFHYNYMLTWCDNIKLCFTDTGSLVYRSEGVNLYEVIKEHADIFDFSEYLF